MILRQERWLRRPLTAFVFLDVTDVEASRSLFEEGFGLVVAENRFHPPHSIHGIVKYDAGGTILALNKARPGFPRRESDRTVLVLTSEREVSDLVGGRLDRVSSGRAGDEVRDGDNHRFDVRRSRHARAAVVEIRYLVSDLAATTAYFERCCGWHFQSSGSGMATVASHDIVLSFVESQDEGERHRNGLFLTVFYMPDLSAAHDTLLARGCRFLGIPQTSRIGSTVRFVDPDGHHFCLYEPSEESLSWESGPILQRLITRSTPADRNAQHRPQANQHGSYIIRPIRDQ